MINHRLGTAVSRSDSGLLSPAGFGRLGLGLPRQTFSRMGGWAMALRGKLSLGGSLGVGTEPLSSLGLGAGALARDSCRPWAGV